MVFAGSKCPKFQHFIDLIAFTELDTEATNRLSFGSWSHFSTVKTLSSNGTLLKIATEGERAGEVNIMSLKGVVAETVTSEDSFVLSGQSGKN